MFALWECYYLCFKHLFFEEKESIVCCLCDGSCSTNRCEVSVNQRGQEVIEPSHPICIPKLYNVSAPLLFFPCMVQNFNRL